MPKGLQRFVLLMRHGIGALGVAYARIGVMAVGVLFAYPLMG